MEKEINAIISHILSLEVKEKVSFINMLRTEIHNASPFVGEPVDLVLWVDNTSVVANDYNPNKVAPPEMQLLEISILNDGYTQPIVTWDNEDKKKIEVIDGFHRHRVGKESLIINKKIHGYLPIVSIRKEQQSKNDRIASTIRHNRARGKHQVDAMSEIILELKNRNWKNARIAKELGMDEDEILRLCQITGLESLFKDGDFSRSWESSDSIENYEPLTDQVEIEDEDFRTVNTSDPDRIFHTFDKWECYKHGFYASTHPELSSEECEIEYFRFLSDIKLFESALIHVTEKWKNSCEHYLTNKAMNRIAWLGQASVCFEKGIPSRFCAGFNMLSETQQKEANEMALKYLNKWNESNGRQEENMESALSIGRQVSIY